MVAVLCIFMFLCGDTVVKITFLGFLLLADSGVVFSTTFVIVAVLLFIVGVWPRLYRHRMLCLLLFLTWALSFGACSLLVPGRSSNFFAFWI